MEDAIWSVGGNGGDGGDGGAGSNGMNGGLGSNGTPGLNGVDGAPGADGQPGSQGELTPAVPELVFPDPVFHLDSAAFEALLDSIGGPVHQVEASQPPSVPIADFWIL